jgi:hypothetical protein
MSYTTQYVATVHSALVTDSLRMDAGASICTAVTTRTENSWNYGTLMCVWVGGGRVVLPVACSAVHYGSRALMPPLTPSVIPTYQSFSPIPLAPYWRYLPLQGLCGSTCTLSSTPFPSTITNTSSPGTGTGRLLTAVDRAVKRDQADDSVQECMC